MTQTDFDDPPALPDGQWEWQIKTAFRLTIKVFRSPDTPPEVWERIGRLVEAFELEFPELLEAE